MIPKREARSSQAFRKPFASTSKTSRHAGRPPSEIHSTAPARTIQIADSEFLLEEVASFTISLPS